MIRIVNYGLGNIQAILNIYKSLNIEAGVATTARELEDADRIMLPGVGAFDWAMQRLDESGMRECLDDLVMRRKRPVLGICVGMQMMACSSEEGSRPGLGWIDAEVRRLDRGESGKIRLPHMGWNDVTPQSDDPLFAGMDGLPRFYFLHSYYFAPRSDNVVLGTTHYNGRFTSAVRAGDVIGAQFHPEKSHYWGIQFLKNFATL